MLGAIRERATGMAAYAIIFLISVPFALWGIGEYLTFGANPEVAIVNGEDLTLVQFQEAYQELQLQGERPPEQVPADVWADLQRNQALQQLIGQEVHRQFLMRTRLQPPDGAVADNIRRRSVFLTGGKFDPDRYRRMLRTNRMDAKTYEAEERSRMANGWLTEALAESAWAPPSQGTDYETLRSETRDVRMWLVPWKDFVEDVEITDEAIEERFERDEEAYRSPARARVSYVELLQENLEIAELTEEDLRYHYETNAATYARPEVRTLRQIFLSYDAGDADEGGADLAAKLAEGADFAELAKANSEDALSAPLGGLMGRVAANELPEEVRPIVFALGENKTSAPIPTERGVYIYRVEGIQAEEIPLFEEVRERVRGEAERAAAERRFAIAAEDLEVLAYENPDTLAPAAEAVGAEVISTDWIYLQQPTQEVLAEAPVQDVFHDEAVRSGINSARIDIAGGHSIVVRMEEFEPEQVRPLEVLREEIEADLTREAGMERAQAAALEILGRLRAGGDFAAEAEAAESRLLVYPGIPRTGDDDGEIGTAVLNQFFAMKLPDTGSAYQVMDAPLGVIILALDGVHQTVPEELTAQGQLLQRNLNLRNELDAFDVHLMAQSDIEQFPERLQ